MPPGLYLSSLSQPAKAARSERRADCEELTPGCLKDVDNFSQDHRETALAGKGWEAGDPVGLRTGLQVGFQEP